jgi:transposase
MPKAYSEDLRWRAVWLHLVRGFSYADVAQTLCAKRVCIGTWHPFMPLAGGVDPQIPKRGPDKCLTEFELFTILQSVIIKPTSFLCEMQYQLLYSTGKWVHVSTTVAANKKLTFRFVARSF